jgi:5S rRNA maturation endonuclease (ribonuclease M5)
VRYEGRNIDPVALWSEYTDIPERVQNDSPFISGLWCPNPAHQNSRLPGPFQINVTQPTVHCFAECGISGSYERAIAIVKGLTNTRGEPNAYAARKLILKSAARSHRLVQRDGGAKRKSKPATAISDLEYETFIPAFGAEYLDKRGISGSSIAKWQLGWDSDRKRIVIPAYDERATLRFLIRRAVRERDQPKYLYSEGSEKTSLLFGACFLDRERVRSQGLIVVEGSLDTIRLHQHGATNAAGQLGSKLSRRQRDIIAHFRPPRIYLFFDKNIAGARATRAAARLLKPYPLFVMLYPRGKDDPAELSAKEVERAIHKAIPYARFLRRIERITPERKKEGMTIG